MLIYSLSVLFCHFFSSWFCILSETQPEILHNAEVLLPFYRLRSHLDPGFPYVYVNIAWCINFNSDATASCNCNETKPRNHNVTRNIPPSKALDGKCVAAPTICRQRRGPCACKLLKLFWNSSRQRLNFKSWRYMRRHK